MGGIENGVLVGKNLNFDEQAAPPHLGIIDAAGKFPIGSGNLAPTAEILGGTITSPLGTLTIGYSSPNITIDLAGGSTGIDSIGVDTTSGAGTNPVLPDGAGLITITGGQYPTGTYGTRVLTILSPAANTIQVESQISTESASSLITNNGICHFDSTSFAVDANGFVTMAGGGGFTWTDTSGAFSPLKNNGYFITGTSTATLPASPSQGDTIKFFVDHAAQVLTIDAPGTQIIRFGSVVSSAGGTAVSTAQGDSATLVYRSSNTAWECIAFVGNWNLT